MKISRSGPLVAVLSKSGFSRWRWLGFLVSGSLLAISLAALVFQGLALGLDFTGGVLVEAARALPFDARHLRDALAAGGVPDAVIQLSDAGRTVMIRVQNGDARTLEAVRAALGADAGVRSEDMIGPKVSGDLLASGLKACLATVAMIGFYVAFRFKAMFGVAALLSILHDVTLMLGFYAVTGLTFDMTSVAAILLIAGYSINDTVVVFDRLREMRARHPEMPFEEVIDIAIATTLRRTLMTSATTLVAALSLLVLGGPVLFGLAASVTFGLVVGTLSSIFIAAQLLLHLPRLGAEP